MAKSNLVLLQEALEAGDVAKAQELTAKLVKSGKIKTTKTRVKVEVAEKAPRKPAKVATKPKAKPRARQDIDVSHLDESSYLAPSRVAGHDEHGGRTFIGKDGKEHTFAKKVSLEGVKFVNKFDPSEYAVKLSAKEEKLEKQIKKFKPVPRPGQRGVQRDVSQKVEARCAICHNVVRVYPWEVETVDGESSFRCSKKSCIKAR